MPINRGPWNTLQDDDGSNLTGTIWNKDKIKTVVLDPVDALFAPFSLGAQTVVPTFTSGQNDNLAVGATTTTLIMQSTVATYLTGIVAPAQDGAVHILLNVGGPLITLAHLFGSSVPNQFIGAGYANTDLPTWRAVMIQYVAGYAKWVVLKP